MTLSEIKVNPQHLALKVYAIEILLKQVAPAFQCLVGTAGFEPATTTPPV